MSFDLSPTAEQAAAVAAVRELCAEVREVARSANESGELPADLRAALVAAAEADPAAVAAGRSVLCDPVGLLLVTEELAVADAGVALDLVGAVQAPLLLAAAGGDTASLLGRRSSLAMYEGFGRAPSEYRARAAKTDSGPRLHGRKDSVIGLSAAEVAVVCGRGDDDGPAVFVVPVPADGVTVERDDRRSGKLALGLAGTCAVRFDNVPVETVRCGTSASEDLAVLRAVSVQRLVIPMISVGLAQAAVDTTAEWTAGRSVRGAALARNQGVTFPLVDADIVAGQARLLLWSLVTRLPEMTDAADIERRVSRAVAIGCEAGSKAARLSCNTMGWRGLSHQYLAEKRYRDSGVLAAMDFDPLRHAVPAVEAA